MGSAGHVGKGGGGDGEGQQNVGHQARWQCSETG